MNPFEQPSTLAPTPQTEPAAQAAKATHSSMPADPCHQQTVRIHVAADRAISLDVGQTNLPQNLDPSIRAGLTCSHSPQHDPFTIPQPYNTAPWHRNKAPMGTRPKACMYDRTIYSLAQPLEPKVTEAAETNAAETTMWCASLSPVSDDDASPGIPGSAMSTGSKDEKPEDEKPEDEKPMSKRAREREEGRNRPKSKTPRANWWSQFFHLKGQGASTSKIVEELGEAPPKASKASKAGKGK